MNTSAIIMLVVSILLVWGGLAAAILYMVYKPLDPDRSDDSDPDEVDDSDAGEDPENPGGEG